MLAHLYSFSKVIIFTENFKLEYFTHLFFNISRNMGHAQQALLSKNHIINF